VQTGCTSVPLNAAKPGELCAKRACETPVIALASVIVTNYNYGHFLRAALDSALAQSPRPEVVVVDDGSTDDSRQTIASYGDDVVPVLKDNGGQASAFNAGLARASGDVVIFLDADDTLLPGAVERVLAVCADENASKAHWQMWELDEEGRLVDQLVPREALSYGDLREAVVSGGPGAIDCPPTSGNAWSRRFLDAVFPMPERGFERAGADAYLGTLAPLYGTVACVERPLSAFRKHEESNFGSRAFDARMELHRVLYDRCCEGLERECRRRGLEFDRRRWDAESWICPLQDFVAAVQRYVSPGRSFILIDDNQFGLDETAGRIAVQLIERDGVYWGPPESDAAAIQAFEARAADGVEFLALAPGSRWWLDEYPDFFNHLFRSADVVIDDDRLRLYRLRAPAATRS
jgi:glycosyltransferase involved in cell wall biosynthesis